MLVYAWWKGHAPILLCHTEILIPNECEPEIGPMHYTWDEGKSPLSFLLYMLLKMKLISVPGLE